MREGMIVGRPNCGKTMFALNFAQYLGSKSVAITAKSPDGILNCRHFSIEEAKRELCSALGNKTRALQSMALKMTIGKTALNFKLTDTCGVSEEIHKEENVRKAMAQTLGAVREASFIIHLVDLAAMAQSDNGHNTIDQEFYQYGSYRKAYLMLANKIDLPAARENLTQLICAYPAIKIIPVSALYGQGFDEVKARVAKNI
jgi:predicted GTPase